MKPNDVNFEEIRFQEKGHPVVEEIENFKIDQTQISEVRESRTSLLSPGANVIKHFTVVSYDFSWFSSLV
jgi:hypothetical protein